MNFPQYIFENHHKISWDTIGQIKDFSGQTGMTVDFFFQWCVSTLSCIMLKNDQAYFKILRWEQHVYFSTLQKGYHLVMKLKQQI